MKKNGTNSANSHVVIRISNLKKKFGALVAVDGLTFDVYKGEIFGFLGPNGAGKTTSINMICGLYPPTEGEVVIEGEKIKQNTDIKSYLGICPQENIFWHKLTCQEQLVFMGEMYGLPRKLAKSRSTMLLEMLGLNAKMNVIANKLSGGMKRRLNICLALIHDPEILILDEPEAGLDPQSRILVRNFIKSLAKDKTIILTTHNMDEADRLADRVAIIDYGKLLLLDTPERLKKSIGQGDILEIELNTNDMDTMKKISERISDICDNVNISGYSLIIRSKNSIKLISEITNKIKEFGVNINEIRMRENTLEDVFIHLTGRKLRE